MKLLISFINEKSEIDMFAFVFPRTHGQIKQANKEIKLNILC